MTCAACVHFPRCVWLIGALPSWTKCDWIPSRFTPRPNAGEPDRKPPVAPDPPERGF